MLNAHRLTRSELVRPSFQIGRWGHRSTAGILHKLADHCLPGRLLVQQPSTVTNHDDRAALVCALTALCVAAGDFLAVGDVDGWIILPPRAFVQDWAIGELEANAAGEALGTLHFEKPFARGM